MGPLARALQVLADNTTREQKMASKNYPLLIGAGVALIFSGLVGAAAIAGYLPQGQHEAAAAAARASR